MLEELLKLIREGGSFDSKLLAEKLNTSPEMVSAMIEHLQRMGMIRTFDAGQSPCQSCALSGMCDPEKKRHDAQHLWLFEETTKSK